VDAIVPQCAGLGGLMKWWAEPTLHRVIRDTYKGLSLVGFTHRRK